MLYIIPISPSHMPFIIIQTLLPHVCQHPSVSIPVTGPVSEDVALVGVLLQNQIAPITG